MGPPQLGVLRGVGGEFFEAPGQLHGTLGPPGVLEGVAAQTQLAVPGQQAEVIRFECEPLAEGAFGLGVVIVLVLRGVGQGEPAVEIGMRTHLVDPLPRGTPDGTESARQEQLLAALVVLVDRRHASRPWLLTC